MQTTDQTVESIETTELTYSQTGSNTGQPGQSKETIAASTAQHIAELNHNMSKMAALLQQMVEQNNTPLNRWHKHDETSENQSDLDDCEDSVSLTASNSDIQAFLDNDCAKMQKGR